MVLFMIMIHKKAFYYSPSKNKTDGAKYNCIDFYAACPYLI